MSAKKKVPYRPHRTFLLSLRSIEWCMTLFDDHIFLTIFFHKTSKNVQIFLYRTRSNNKPIDRSLQAEIEYAVYEILLTHHRVL
jgi:hypothetical protein